MNNPTPQTAPSPSAPGSGAAPAGGSRAATPEIAPSLLFLLVAFIGMQPFSTDMYLATLPALTDAFSTTPAAVQMTLTAFMIGFAGAQLIAGPLSDRFGRRPTALWGLVLYTSASLLGALAPTLAVLVFARLIQAFGVCCTVVCSRAIVRDRYEVPAGAQVMARAMTWMSLVPIVGPIACAILLAALGWRSNFVVMVLGGALVLAATWRWLPETNMARDRHATDLGPLLKNYLHIGRNGQFWAFTMMATLSYGALFSFISGSSFVIIRVLGIPSQYFGFTFAFIVCGYLVGTWITRWMLPIIGLYGTLYRGAALSCASGAVMAAFALAGMHTLATLLLPMVGVMVAHAILQSCAQVGAVGPFPRNTGAAVAMFGFVLSVAAALVGTWIGASHDGTVVPLALTIGVITLCVALVAATLVRRTERRDDEVAAALSKAASGH